MRWTQFALTASLVALVACTRSMPGGTGSPEPAQVAAPHHAQQSSEAQLALGEQLFQRVCSACHSLEAPPRAAPPMTHVARHYRQAFADPADGMAHIVEFVRAPSADRSVLPAHARERWGLMPPLSLPDAELEAVARYVWQLPEPKRGMGGRGIGAARRRGGDGPRCCVFMVRHFARE
jgi:cytochrome c